MWVRKSDQQIATDRHRIWLCLRGPVSWFFIIVGMAVMSVFSPRNAEGHWPRDWLVYLCVASLIAGGVAVVVYGLQYFFGMRFNPFGTEVVICDKCHRVKRLDDDHNCECGGAFDDFDRWTWIDDDRPNSTAPEQPRRLKDDGCKQHVSNA